MCVVSVLLKSNEISADQVELRVPIYDLKKPVTVR